MDSNKLSAQVERLEVVETGRRRRWTDDEKLKIVLEQGKKPMVISPLALEAVRRIDALFEIERSINGETLERRQAVRQELSAPLLADPETWMRQQRAKLSPRNRCCACMRRISCATE